MHPTNGSASFKSSSSPAASTLRPRARRLISIEDDLNPPYGETYAYRADSRTSSPANGSKSASSTVTSVPTSTFHQSIDAQDAHTSKKTGIFLYNFMGKPWTTIQNLATNALGTEPAVTTAPTRRRKPQLTVHRRAASSTPSKQWGPTPISSSQIGIGAQEERESMVRAMMRKDLLTAHDHIVPDSVGRYKRRNSDDRLSSSAPPGDNEDRDALIYIHHVRPEDTLAGITIKYNCQPAVLRKANRMWPNDSIQSKKIIVLPVNACDVKGSPVNGPDVLPEVDLLLGDWGDQPAESSDLEPAHSGLNVSLSQKFNNSSALSSSPSTTEVDAPWKHDSWVLLPDDKKPTEIGRVPCRALGYFPPARRKSLTFSDASTSKPSIDLPRSPTSTNRPPQSPPRGTRPRASSNLSSVSTAQRNRQRTSSGFRLHGPGGVGTMGFNVRSPGPGRDGLNKLFAAHLPNVDPPPEQEYFTPWGPSLLDSDAGTSFHHTGSAAHTPNGGVDFQQMGGAIEGWVRRVGGQASKLLSEPSTPGQGRKNAQPAIGVVGGDFGDLIELRDDLGEVEESRGRAEDRHSLTPLDEQHQGPRSQLNLTIRSRGKVRGRLG